MAGRKTVGVAEVIRMVNRSNRLGQGSAEHRAGHNALLETILHATENYEGFRYLRPNEVPEGEQPGLIAGPDGEAIAFPDETRREYICKVQDEGPRGRPVGSGVKPKEAKPSPEPVFENQMDF
jgi:hypothetical protein